MTARPHIAPDPASLPRPSARVAHVADLLDCDVSDVRRLIEKGELQAHRKGVRGVRVFLDSVRAYQDRRPIEPKGASFIHRPKPRAPASLAAHRAALAGLRAKGLA